MNSTLPFIADPSQVDSTCPGGAGHLETEYTIVVDRSNYTGFVWVRPDGRYVVTCNPGCSPTAGYRATMNTTNSTLTIENIRAADAGTWKIVDAKVVDATPVEVCQLTAVDIPQCSISSDEDTDSLEPGTQLTLTVDITGYYCSVETGFDLTTSDVTEELGIRHNVSVVTDLTINTTFSVDITRLGDVTLDFTCDGRRPLTCGGVKRLQKSPPQCTITSDKYTASLEPGTNLTLVVDIKSFYCPQQARVLLTTGTITQTLPQNQTMDDIVDVSLQSYFPVTTDRFGDVGVSLVCGNITTMITCDGVNRLSEAATITSTLTERSQSTATAETPNSSPGNTAPETSTTPTPPTVDSVSPLEIQTTLRASQSDCLSWV
ncbi:uncharacterized protein LOC124262625 [Haliotis rubra]|uniref:uncharacterized protein LOC124262625 n=1 Tax=Haliotis rubra TaxID=36100 RepID=UPI001EE4F04A|nr:uncharacterized protein LOC124262625 [Haliotis rubra]